MFHNERGFAGFRMDCAFTLLVALGFADPSRSVDEPWLTDSGLDVVHQHVENCDVCREHLEQSREQYVAEYGVDMETAEPEFLDGLKMFCLLNKADQILSEQVTGGVRAVIAVATVNNIPMPAEMVEYLLNTADWSSSCNQSGFFILERD